jgi:hypothetical protein
MPFSYTVKFVCGVNRTERPCTTVRQGIYATDINIHNFDRRRKAKIEKSALLLVRKNQPVGREPAIVKTEPFDRIVLPPRTATMDDCCRLNEKLQLSDAALNVGFLELVSDIELNVTVVYTATDLSSRSIAIDVETVAARQVP